MTTTGQWVWYAGVTVVVLDGVSVLHGGPGLQTEVSALGLMLMIAGLSIMVINSAWDAWEQFEADDGGEPV